MAHRTRWTCLCLLLVIFSAGASWRAELAGAQRLGSGEFLLHLARPTLQGPQLRLLGLASND